MQEFYRLHLKVVEFSIKWLIVWGDCGNKLFFQEALLLQAVCTLLVRFHWQKQSSRFVNCCSSVSRYIERIAILYLENEGRQRVISLASVAYFLFGI